MRHPAALLLTLALLTAAAYLIARGCGPVAADRSHLPILPGGLWP